MKRRLFLVATALLPILGSCQKSEEKPAATAEPAPPAKVEKVRLKTNLGDIVIELNRGKAPVTVENFLGYVNRKHYDGTAFHRVIDGFMIQGGGFAIDGGQLVEKPVGSPIVNEGQNGLKNVRGSIAMARTSDINSATAQFFINVADNRALDYPSNGGYAVFGQVVEGMEVVDKIKAVPTGTYRLGMRSPTGRLIQAPAQDVPQQAVLILAATAE
jgi:cyclophilin family peptidyl-prolyl cis-trans isomerase